MGLGALRERLVIQQNTPAALVVSSLTRTSTTATAVTATAHGYTSTDYVRIAGATPSGYNASWKVTVVDPVTFTFTVSNTLTTPATGTITATYQSDAQGGRRIGWTALPGIGDGIWAELVPVRALERLQAQALQSEIDYRFRVRTRSDITPEMRAIWRPSWLAVPPTHTLEIHGVLPDGDGRTYMLLEAGELG